MADDTDDKTKSGMTRRDFMTTSAAATTLGLMGLSNPAGGEPESEGAPAKKFKGPHWLKGKRPNFLIIMGDEIRYPPTYETPEAKAFRQTYLKTQNALRERGMEFHWHYPATVACVPSRTSLFTGHYPSLHGVTQTTGAAKESNDADVFWLDPNTVPTLGDYFRAAGYQTYLKGKWHLSDADIQLPGTHDQIVSYDSKGLPDPAQEALYLEANRLDQWGFSGWIGPEPHGSSALNSGSSAKDALGRDVKFATQVVQLIRQLHKGKNPQPWLIVSSFVNPHDITLWGFFANNPQSKFDFTIQEIVPKFLLDPAPSGPTQSEDLSANNKPSCQASYRDAYASVFQPILFTEEYVRFYYQLQKTVDEQMMRVYKALRNSRFWEDTIVIFTSDHGDLLGSHGGMHQKWYTAYEEAIHVPLIISNPSLFPQPQSVDIPTSHVDLLPTLLGLAGVDQEKLHQELAQNHSDAQPLVGRDLSPLVLNEVDPESLETPLYFMTDDDVSRGLNQENTTGVPYNSVIQPNHIESVIARLSDGNLWKYSRYFDNPQFWSNPTPPPSDTVVTPPPGQPPSTEGTYELQYTVTVKQMPLPDEFEMYNLTDDILEESSLYGNPAYHAQQQALAVLLQQQCAQKRLVPNPANGTVPSQPSC